MLDIGLAVEPLIAVDLARLVAHLVHRCGCGTSIDVLNGERVAVAVICPEHLAHFAFADSAE